MSKKLYKFSDDREIDIDTVASTVINVLDGTLGIGSSGVPLDGFIPVSRLNEVITIGAEEEKILSSAYYPRPITIRGLSIEEQTQATATPDKILLGETAWVNGELITGALDTDVIMDFALETAASATPDKILLGETAWVNGDQIIGTMPNNGTINETICFDSFFGIPLGYTDGGTIIGPSLIDSTPADAVSEEIALGKTAWINGELVTGTMSTVDIIRAKEYDSELETMDGTQYLRLVSDNEINVCLHANKYMDIPKSLLVDCLKITPNKIANGFSICGVKGDAGFTVVKGEHSSMLEDGEDILLDFNIDNNYLIDTVIETKGTHIINIRICFDKELEYYGDASIVMSPTAKEVFNYFYIHHPADRNKFAVMKYRSTSYSDENIEAGNLLSISTTGLGTMVGIYTVNAYYDWSIME